MFIDVTEMSKDEVIEFLHSAEKKGVKFEDDFKLMSGDRDVTKLYLCRSLQGGYYPKYLSREELANRMN